MLELVEMNCVHPFLLNYDFPGDDTPIIPGSALNALERSRITSVETR